MSSAIVECRVSETAAPRSRTVIAVLSLITAVGAALRFVNLGLRGLSFDESIDLAIARLGWPEMQIVLKSREANLTLYHVLLHFWARLGTSEYFVRSLSALFGTATLVLLYLLGKRLFGTRTGLAAAALLAVNGYHVRYSQEAQSYSLVVLLAVLSSLLFTAALEGGSSTWNWYAAVSILSAYVHPLGALVTLAQFVSLRFSDHWRDRTKEIRQSGLSITVGWLPLIWFLAFKSKGQSAQSSIQSIPEWFVRSAGPGNHLFLALCALAAVAAIAGLLQAGRLFSRDLRFSLALPIFWVLLPSGLMLALALRKPGSPPCYLVMILPAMVLLLSAALNWIRSRLAWGLALAVLLGVSLSGIRNAYSAGFEPKREYMREVTRYILNNSRSGDGAVFYAPYGRIAFEYYREIHSASVIRPRVFFPLRGDGILTASASASDPALLAPDTLLMVELARRQRVWLVRTGEQDNKCETLQKWLAERFPQMERHGFGPTRFFLYSK